MRRFNRNNLDEMQEQKLLKIESRGCWFAFWGLFLSMQIQLFLTDAEEIRSRLSGEFIVFMCLAIYLLLSCLKAGIWDRRFKASPLVNLAASLIGSTAAGLLMGILSYREYRSLSGSLATAAVYFVSVFIATYLVMTISMVCYKKRIAKLEAEDEAETSAGTTTQKEKY